VVEDLKKVIIYTDGACVGNPGPGGYGIVLLYNHHRKELSGGFKHTTNNRMEMLATIVALKALKGRCHVLLHTDSTYVANGISKGWAKRWRSNGWKLGSGGKAVNTDLWSQLLDLCDRHRVEFKWVRGHSGDVENERCDLLAVTASKGQELESDLGYEDRQD